jgi:branched-chain amino acid transport system substrate-binding protein
MGRLGTGFGTLALLAALGGSPALADVTLGLAAPLSGSAAHIGEEMKLGMTAAIADLNAHGGILHQKVALDSQDDGCEAKQGVAAASRLIEHKVSFVFGHSCAAAALPASYVYAENGALAITIASEPSVTEQGYDGLFRLAGRDDQQGKLLADFLSRRFTGKRLALLAERSAYGTDLAAALRAGLARRNQVETVLDLPVDAGTKDFSRLIAQLEDARADAVLYAGSPAAMATLVKQAAAAGLKPQFLSGNALGDRQFWSASGDSAEGTLFSFMADATSLPSAHDVVGQLQARGIDPQGYTLYGYAAVQLYAAAIERAQTLDAEAVALEFAKGSLVTVLGEISFNDNGDNAAPDWRLYRWSNGRYRYAE